MVNKLKSLLCVDDLCVYRFIGNFSPIAPKSISHNPASFSVKKQRPLHEVIIKCNSDFLIANFS